MGFCTGGNSGRGRDQTMKVVELLASSSGVQSILLQVQTLAEVDVPLVRGLELLVHRTVRAPGDSCGRLVRQVRTVVGVASCLLWLLLCFRAVRLQEVESCVNVLPISKGQVCTSFGWFGQ